MIIGGGMLLVWVVYNYDTSDIEPMLGIKGRTISLFESQRGNSVKAFKK